MARSKPLDDQDVDSGGGEPIRDRGWEAYVKVRDAIADGILVAGMRVTETDLSARFEMSRTPIREAVYRLEAEGLLSYEARRGLVVTRPDHQMIMELYTMREALEGTAARLAAQHASEAELGALSDILDDELRVMEEPQPLSHLNRRFHSLIYMSAHNRYLLKSLENLASTIALLPTMLDVPGRPARAHEEHAAMFKAISARDGDAAEEAARNHIRSARRQRVDILSKALVR